MVEQKAQYYIIMRMHHNYEVKKNIYCKKHDNSYE